MEWDKRAASGRTSAGWGARAPDSRLLAATVASSASRAARTLPVAWILGVVAWAAIVASVVEICTTRASAHLVAASNVVVLACLAGIVTVAAALLQRRFGAPRTGEALGLGVGQLVALWPVVVIVETIVR